MKCDVKARDSQHRFSYDVLCGENVSRRHADAHDRAITPRKPFFRELRNERAARQGLRRKGSDTFRQVG